MMTPILNNLSGGGLHKMRDMAPGESSGDYVTLAQVDQRLQEGLIGLSDKLPKLTVRQTVLSGRINSDGCSNCLSVGDGLKVVLNASSLDKLYVTFADGFSESGEADFVGCFSTSQSVTVSPGQSFVFCDRDPLTGTLSLGSTDKVPVYSNVPPTPAVDKHWFNLADYKMRVWAGTGGWVPVQRVFLGESFEHSGQVARVLTYAYQRRFASPWIRVDANDVILLIHNLGINHGAGQFIVQGFASSTGSDEDCQNVSSFILDGELHGFIEQPSAYPRNEYTFRVGGKTHKDFNLGWLNHGFYKVLVSVLF
jgi:hypothetical protein